jgi:integrase
MSRLGSTTTSGYLDWDVFLSLISKMENKKEYKFTLLISIGVYTGLRISDLLTLKYKDILNNNILNINERKTKKVRKIKINEDLKNIVERIYLKQGGNKLNEYIFLNRFGTKPIDRSYVNTKLKYIFSYYKIKIDGNVSSHLFRKTLGRRVMEVTKYSSESLILLMDLFGHTSPSITKRYLGIRDQEIFNVYDSLSLN